MRWLELRESVATVEVEKDTWWRQVKEARSREGRPVLRPLIEAIHARTTRNFVTYAEESLRGNPRYRYEGLILPTGVYSMTKPYPKPMLIDHEPDIYGRAITGRITWAQFVQQTPRAGIPGILIRPEITDLETIERILDGRFFTVSIGAHTDEAFCSICGQDWVQELCDHRRGEKYDGQVMTLVTGKRLWFKEVSWVNIPADEYAVIVDLGDMEGLGEESFQMKVVDTLLQAEEDHRTGEVRVLAESLAPRGRFLPGLGVQVPESERKARRVAVNTQPQRLSEALLANNWLHRIAERPERFGWTQDQVEAAHRDLVQWMASKGWRHPVKDELDTRY